jgi:hypothetical protein
MYNIRTSLTETVNEQGQTSSPSSIIHIRVLSELGSHDLGDPGSGVEQIREPTHESANLDVTDSSDRLGKMDHSFVDSVEDVGKFAMNRASVKHRIDMA